MRTIAPQYRNYSKRVRQDFREDYSDMRSWGLNHDQIAARFGVKRDSLLRRCARHDIYIPEPHERVVFERLDQLIDSGLPFTAAALPPVTAPMKVAALRHAMRAGRIQSIGSEVGRRGGISHRLQIWLGIVENQEVAA